MARDAQLSGDRVQTEYYLQYADHYFRVLSENRARFEDQRPRREPDLDEDEGDEELVETNDESAAEERAERHDRSERPDRGDRFNRERRPRRDERVGRETAENEGRQTNGGGETIPFDVLPPAIGRDESETAEVSEEEPRRPRRRSRGPRPADGEDEIAPAA
jgi:hypothetical protein